MRTPAAKLCKQCLFSTKATANTNQLQVQYFPKAPKASARDISNIQDFIWKCNNMLVLSGAGLSTESGVPDYRSKDVGLYDRTDHKPMQHNEFVKSSTSRKKYWARNYMGWNRFTSIKPNAAHFKLSQLENDGKLSWHVTQNVDTLCAKSGSKNLTELHGSMQRVVCMNCKAISQREELQKRFEELNRHWSAEVLGYGPDADVFLKDEDVVDFIVPPCLKCGGVLKPDVVFFGDNVPGHVVEFVYKKVEESDGMLVVGTSLHVWSGFRFVQRASKCDIPIAAINVGPTRANDLLSIKVNALCTQVLQHIS